MTKGYRMSLHKATSFTWDTNPTKNMAEVSWCYPSADQLSILYNFSLPTLILDLGKQSLKTIQSAQQAYVFKNQCDFSVNHAVIMNLPRELYILTLLCQLIPGLITNSNSPTSPCFHSTYLGPLA